MAERLDLKTIKDMPIFAKISYLLATWFGSGLSPKAPGTMGSFCSLPLVWLASFYGFWGVLIASVLIFFVGWYTTDVVLKTQKKHDPGYVVIDETVGQTLTFLWVATTGMSWYIYLIGFGLFRFFDIVKIWPASYFDKKVENAFGVMTDDVVAGLYASLVLFGLVYFVF